MRCDIALEFPCSAGGSSAVGSVSWSCNRQSCKSTCHPEELIGYGVAADAEACAIAMCSFPLQEKIIKIKKLRKFAEGKCCALITRTRSERGTIDRMYRRTAHEHSLPAATLHSFIVTKYGLWHAVHIKSSPARFRARSLFSF